MHKTMYCLEASTVIHNWGGLNLNHYKHRGKPACDPATEITANLQLPSKLNLKEFLRPWLGEEGNHLGNPELGTCIPEKDSFQSTA